jgi:paraquat-inducible protein B
MPDEPGARPLMEQLVERGLRAQLRSTSLITGQLAVSLDLHSSAPPAVIKYGGRHPELPTIPTDLEEITRSVSQVLDRLAALPVDALVEDMRTTLRAFQALAESSELKQSLRSLDDALQAVSSIARKADAQVGPTLTAIATAANSADSAIKQAERTFASVEGNLGSDSPLARDVAELLVQLRDAARAIRVLADYLAQHPEALVRGKGGRAN